MKKEILSFVVGIGFFMPVVAVGATARISSPYVEKGQTKIEWQGYYGFDKNARQSDQWKQRYVLGYGVTEWWRAQIRTSYEKSGLDGADPRITNTAFENTFQLTDRGAYFFDVGVKLDYVHAYKGNDPDVFSSRLILAKDTENFAHLFNFRIDQGIGGGNDRTGGGLAYGIKYKYSEQVQPGIELYEDIGSFKHGESFRAQNRSIGPVVSGKIASINYHVGYLFGLTDMATDGVLKMSLDYRF